MTSDSSTRPPWWPTAANPAASAVMQANHRVDTGPERRLRSLLHRRGLRFRKDMTIRYDGTWTRPDVVFTRARVVVYVDGCFWHGCPEHGTRPTNNADYWTAKLARNVERDRQATAALTQAGWTVTRAWEHEPVEVVAARVERLVRASDR